MPPVVETAARSPSQSSGSHKGSPQSSPRSASSNEAVADGDTSPGASAKPSSPMQKSPPVVVVPAVVGITAAAPVQSPTSSGLPAMAGIGPTSPALSTASSPMGSSLSSTVKSANVSGGGLPPSSPKGALLASPSNNRPRPVLDHGTGNHSARSSNPSEISEDFRSDFGISSPPVSARSDRDRSLNVGGSLEISASASMDSRALPSMDGDVDRTDLVLGLTPDKRPQVESQSPSKASLREGAPKSWQSLSLDLKTLAEALVGMKLIRSKQQEYLRHIKLEC